MNSIISNGVKLLIGGFIMGWGPCLAFCAPVLLPYIGATKTTWREGLRIGLVFSVGRLLSLSILGALATFIFSAINRLFPSHRSVYLYFIVALFILIIGIFIILGKGFRIPLGKTIEREILDSGTKSMLLLGFLIGISPCTPMVSILTYIACVSENVISGILYAVFFGIGTAASSIVLGTLTGTVSGKLLRPPQLRRIFQVACGLVLVLFGVQLIYHLCRSIQY